MAIVTRRSLTLGIGSYGGNLTMQFQWLGACVAVVIVLLAASPYISDERTSSAAPTVTSAPSKSARTAPASAHELAADADQSKWDKARLESSQALGAVSEATRKTATEAWEVTKEKSLQAWDVTKSGADKAAGTTKETTAKVWETTKAEAQRAAESTSQAWERTKSTTRDIWNSIKGAATGADGNEVTHSKDKAAPSKP